MNCVGVDVSKGKSMIAVMRPLGELVIPPFEVAHNDAELRKLSRLLGDLDGETRVVMEATGNYHLPVASFLCDSGFYVSVVNAMLVYGYGNNSLRRAKTDKKNAIKLSNYSLDRWLMLYCFGEFIYEQIADMEGYTKRAVKFSVDIALKNLKEIFQG